MNDVLKSKLQQLADDEVMLEAIKAVFEEVIDDNKPTEITDNELLGQNYRAYREAQEMLRVALIEIESYKVSNAKSEITNKHR